MVTLLQKELEEKFDAIWIWTDSMSNLAYIQNEKSRFNIFIGNRLEEIRAMTSVSWWRYVPGADNVADVLTRPFNTPKDFGPWHVFYRGPDFLYRPENEWPSTPRVAKIKDTDPEICRRQVDVNVVEACVESPGLEETWFVKVGNFYRLQVHVAVFLRLQAHFRHDSDGHRPPIRTGRVGVDELLAAHDQIVKTVQRKYFAVEIEAIENGRDVPRTSAVWRYKPIIAGGLLRISGRLTLSAHSFAWKHPLVLPSKGHVSELIINSVHDSSAHGTFQMVLNDLRQRYHIPRARQAVKRVVDRCVSCKRYTRRVSQQQMADLPSVRLQLRQPVFNCTGCDMAGPFMVRRGRGRVEYNVIYAFSHV